ncbi:flippase [Thermococcus thioreducens]|uniref:Membrane protein involved in the export of O-antigen and teichoic acid n=1 Tax=Thermococcus thioreducens TaxID=277988 RepID=A0A0Q2XQA7_9EURY|nr:flippase [Thermococcus thioreducens]ASJ11452.1 peptide-binding protein [Thermococcus thioreducens]KQH83468.1 peptide-binding protein [Thermococcus thioreducens]SEW06495.1 Membrane protein involved in the export of O-antigen and teichoic acid [Thermococcus thioreducens]
MSESLKLRLIKNAGWLFGAEIFSKLLAYGIIVILSRTLGPDGLGQYSFIFYYIGLLGIFSDLGVSFYFMREVARDRDKLKELLPDVLGFKIVLAILNFGIIVLITLFLPKPEWMKLLIVLAGAEAMLTWVSLVFVRMTYAFEITKYEAIARTVERFWAFFIGGAVLWHFKELFPFVAVLLVGYTIRELLRIRWGLSFVPGKIVVRFRPAEWANLLRKSYPFWLIGLFTLIYYRTDMVMLNLLRGDYETGIYRAAYMWIQVAMLVPNVVIPTTLPSMARLHKENRKTLEALFKKSFQTLLFLGLAGTAGYYLFAKLGILFVFGEKFKESVPVLRILAFAIPFMFLNSLFGSYMNATGRELTFTKITGFTAFLNVTLNYTLILHYGATGAAVATVVSQGVASLVNLKLLDR